MLSLPIPWDEYPDKNAVTGGVTESKQSEKYNWQDKLEEILQDLTDEELWFLERGQAQAGFQTYSLRGRPLFSQSTELEQQASF